MYLLIDISQRDLIHLALFDESFFSEKSYEGQNRFLLECIDKIVRSKKIKVENLRGIMVVVGTGSFTSTRIACVVANSFAYTLQIPLLAIKVEEVGVVQKLIPKLLKQKKGNYLSATYSGEPNIGPSR